MKTFLRVFPLISLLVAFVAPLLAAAPPRVAFIYSSGETTGPAEIRRAVAPFVDEVNLTLFAAGPGGDPLAADTDFAAFDLVFVDGKTDGLEKHFARLAAARIKLAVVNAPGSLLGNVSLAEHPDLAVYWAQASQKNYAGLVRYLLVRVLGRTSPVLTAAGVPPPLVYPTEAFYHPDAPAPGFFRTLPEFLAWYRARPIAPGIHRYDPAQLTLGLYSHLSLFQQENIPHLDALVRATERRGANIITVLGRSSPPLGTLLQLDGRTVIDALIFGSERLHQTNYQAGIAEARRLGVPLLKALNHSRLTPDEFAASPTGLHPDFTSHLVSSERDGMIEPLVVAARGAARGARHFNAPLPGQIEWRIARALAWAKLHRAPNSAKRVVFTYWSEGGGKANIGGDPDDFLDVQGSLVRILAEMKAQGYDTGPSALPDRDTLAQRMALQASNVGTWAPGELAARVKSAEVTLLPEETYRTWFDSLPAVRRAEIVEMWGPPPGDIMVHTDATGKRFLVIPKIQFGHILVAPHPDWGYLQANKALMSVGALPPHHQYLAFFLWLQRDFKANAWVSLFTNLVLQPGKNEGPAADDHVGIMLGSLPHIHPERLGANGGVGNKRKALAQTAGWYNLVVPSDATEQLFELRARLARYTTQADAKLRADAEPLIRAEILRTGLDRALTPLDPATAPFPELIKNVEAFLLDLERAHMPHGSKILGDAPTGSALSDMVTGMLGAELRATLAPLTPSPAVAARPLVAAVVLQGRAPAEALTMQLGKTSDAAEAQLARALDYANRLRTAPREISGILDALSGRYLEPGPMDEPLRQPAALPPGRSLYNFDQDAIPTAEAEAIGVRQAEALIAAHREKHGGLHPTKLAFVIWSGEIAKNHGVTEAQILHLLGTRVMRDARGAVTGVELIPREALGRPRVDVLATTSGAYRDHYQDKVELIAQATRLAAASPEADNPVSVATRAAAAKLTAAGESPERVAALSHARVFSPAPGAYSPSIQFLAKSGDQRGDESRMAELYTSRLSHAYGGGLYGASARPTFEQNLSKVDAATLPRSSNVNGLLDHPMSAGFLGGLNLAAKALTGRDVDLYVSNLRNKEDISIEPAARALQKELRARYFNPKWLKEMQAHGYDGARNMMFLTDHLDLWNSTASKMVSSADWAEVKSVYVEDKLGLNLDAFFEQHNPHAQQVLLANLLGAAARGHWQATAADLAQVARRLAESAAKNGAVCEAGVCRNPALTALVEKSLAGVPAAAELMQAYRGALEKIQSVAAALAEAPAAPAPAAAPAAATPVASAAASAAPTATPSAAPMVEGKVLEDKFPKPDPAAAATSATAFPWLWLGLGTAALALFGFGLTRRAA